LSLHGMVVSFDLSGMEPDFDPIYKLTVSARLHDLRPAGQALPDATLVLSTYLEAFQPDTTPLLPDLLHPAQPASDLGGFLTGKSALVNTGGKVVYHGSILAELFTDSTEHIIVDLYADGAGANAAATRLQGVINLHKGGAEDGTLRALTPLAHAALAVAHGPQPSWQAVIGSLEVPPPAMLGTVGNTAAKRPPSAGPSAVASVRPNPAVGAAGSWHAPVLLGAALLTLGSCIAMVWRVRVSRG
jgi:hypothetical protein